VAAVSKAGGLGCFGANSLSAEQIKEIAGEIRAHTDKPFAINLWVGGTSEPAPSKEQIDRMRLWFVPFYRELGMRPPAAAQTVRTRLSIADRGADRGKAACL